VIVDADEAKKIIPEFAGGIGANAVHEESGELAEDVLAYATELGDNLVLPKVGAAPASIEMLIGRLKADGYTVDLVSVDVDGAEAWRRMIGRWRDTGRIIPPDFMAEVIGRPRQTYEALKAKGAADGYAEIDNSPARGEPRIVREDTGDALPPDLGAVGQVRPGPLRPGEGAREGAAGREGLTPEAGREPVQQQIPEDRGRESGQVKDVAAGHGEGQAGVAAPDSTAAIDGTFRQGAASPEARAQNAAILRDLRDELARSGDFDVATGEPGATMRASELLDELEADDEFLGVLDACTLRGRAGE
jgi:hypothetical protein